MERIRQLYTNMKLRRKLFYSYMLVGIIPILILGYSCFRHSRKSMVELEKEYLEESFRNAVTELNYRNMSFVKLSNAVVFNNTITDVVYHDYQSYYEMYEKYTYDLDPQMILFQNLHEEISQISIYTTNPTIVQHGQTLMPMEKARGEAWYPSGSDNNQIRFRVKDRKEIYSVMNFPEDEAAGLKGVLYIQYDYQKYFKPMTELTGNSCGVRITDAAGRILYQASHLEDKYQLKDDSSLDTEEKELEIQGKRYMVLSLPIENTEWTAYVYKPMHLVEAPTRDIILIVCMLVLLCLCLVMLTARYISGLVIRPVERLSEEMQEMDMNTMCVTLVPRSQDEIGTLITSFQVLLQRIKSLIREVYQAESDRKKFELQALQAQINPHFLYNCLSLINWKAVMAEEDEISQMALRLSEFYRTSLNKGKSIIGVGDEVKNVQSYIELQNILHNYSLSVEYDLDTSVFQYSMVNLILQPVVENAIVHGLDNSKKEVKKLLLEVQSDGADIRFVIEDNGCGMSEEEAERLFQYNTRGYGMKNINDRLKLVYGGEYGVTCQTRQGEGTKVVIRIPKQYEDEMEQKD